MMHGPINIRYLFFLSYFN